MKDLSDAPRSEQKSAGNRSSLVTTVAVAATMGSTTVPPPLFFGFEFQVAVPCLVRGL